MEAIYNFLFSVIYKILIRQEWRINLTKKIEIVADLPQVGNLDAGQSAECTQKGNEPKN